VRESAPFPSWPASEPAIQRIVQKRLDGRVKPGHEGGNSKSILAPAELCEDLGVGGIDEAEAGTDRLVLRP